MRSGDAVVLEGLCHGEEERVVAPPCHQLDADGQAVVAALGDALPPGTDSVEFPGRAVRALLRDPDVARHAGRTISVADLAAEYGFTDIDLS